MQIKIGVALVVLVLLVGLGLDLSDGKGIGWHNEVTASEQAAKLNRVTLKVFPGNNTVQMFEHVGLGDEGVTTQFPDGSTCSKLDGPIRVDFGDGVVLHFLKLNCHGTTGYVNVKWVND